MIFRNQYEVHRFVRDFNSKILSLHASGSGRVSNIIISHRFGNSFWRKALLILVSTRVINNFILLVLQNL